MITGGQATVYVSDMDRAVEFYTKKLGLKLAFRAGNHFAMVDAGKGFIIGLHPAGPRSPKPGSIGQIQIGFGMDRPIHDEVARLSAAGVRFQGPVVDDGEVMLAFFSDPDGTPMYLVESTGKR